MSRRRSFRVRLVRLLAEAWSLKFENDFVAQFSRCFASAGDLADQIPHGVRCDNVQTERVEGPEHRCDLILLNKANFPKVPVLDFSQCERRNRQEGRIRHHPLESHSFLFRLQRQRAGNPCCTRRALPHLLAADFCFHLPTWFFDPGRRGSHAGFLCHDTEK